MSVSAALGGDGALSAALSDKGYEKVLQIMEGDEVLKMGGLSSRAIPVRQGPLLRLHSGHALGRDPMDVAVRRPSSGDQPHLRRRAGELDAYPDGAHPALFTLNGNTARPLGAESDKGIALFSSLDEGQRKQAILNYRRGDVAGRGRTGRRSCPRPSAMMAPQRKMLLDLISEWAGIPSTGAACAHRGDRGGAERHLVRRGPDDGRARPQHRRLLPHPGAQGGHRIRASGEGAAIHRCTSTRWRSYERLRAQEVRRPPLPPAFCSRRWDRRPSPIRWMSTRRRRPFLEKRRVRARIRMNPGAQIYRRVLPDRHQPGRQDLRSRGGGTTRFAVLRALSFSLDGKRLTPKLVTYTFPAPSALEKGPGARSGSSRRRRFRWPGEPEAAFENRQSTPDRRLPRQLRGSGRSDLQAKAQRRNPRQSRYQIDYRQALMGT